MACFALLCYLFYNAQMLLFALLCFSTISFSRSFWLSVSNFIIFSFVSIRIQVVQGNLCALGYFRIVDLVISNGVITWEIVLIAFVDQEWSRALKNPNPSVWCKAGVAVVFRIGSGKFKSVIHSLLNLKLMRF